MSRLRRVRVIADHRVILARSCRTSARRSTVVEHTMDVSGWLRKQLEDASPDLLRAMVKEFAEALMSADADAVCGAGYGERSPERVNRRNGYRERDWDMRVGSIELAVPKLRGGSYFPDWLLQPRRRAEQAFVSVIADAYLAGVSTRRVEKLVQQLGVERMSKSQVSRLAKSLDQIVGSCADFCVSDWFVRRGRGDRGVAAVGAIPAAARKEAMMADMEIPDELIDQLLGEYQGPEQLIGPDGLINRLRRRLIERAAGAELEQHLGYPSGAEPPETQPNRRNGTTAKTLRTVDGPVAVELPRDRDASFEPRIVPKHARSFDGFDEQILALYAGGLTTREIQRH